MFPDSVCIHDENGKLLGALSHIEGTGSLILKTTDGKTITVSFHENNNMPYIRFENANIETVMGIGDKGFNIAVTNAKTRKEKCSLSLTESGEILIARCDCNGNTFYESLEELILRLIQESTNN